MGLYGEDIFARVCYAIAQEKKKRIVKRIKFLEKEYIVDFERTNGGYKISIFEFGNEKPYSVERRGCNTDSETAKEIITSEIKKYAGYNEIDEVERWDGVIA